MLYIFFEHYSSLWYFYLFIEINTIKWKCTSLFILHFYDTELTNTSISPLIISTWTPQLSQVLPVRVHETCNYPLTVILLKLTLCSSWKQHHAKHRHYYAFNANSLSKKIDKMIILYLYRCKWKKNNITKSLLIILHKNVF